MLEISTTEQFKIKVEAPLSLIKHFICASETLDRYNCDTCNYSTHFKTVFTRHHHNQEQSRKAPAIYICGNCYNFQSSSVLFLFKHKINCLQKSLEDTTNYWYKSGRCSFACSSCGYKTKARYKMKSHILVNHTSSTEIPWFKCDLCSYKGKLKQHLQRHLKMHHKTDEKFPHKCELCSYRSPFARNLRRHWNYNHATSCAEVKWFQCEYCDFRAKASGNLIKHINNIHTDPSLIEWVKCEFCPFKAKQKHHLKAHVFRKHVVPKQDFFSLCGECGYKTVDRSNFNRHVDRVHGGNKGGG